ncbi:MAG: hypothetical protein U1F60_03300 [Planctomycetota bacterium]
MPLALARANLFALLLAAVATAQQSSTDNPKPTPSGPRSPNAWTRMVEQALVELDDPALAARAAQRLEHAGPAVVGFVRTQLGAERREALSKAQIRGLLGVLASQGRASLPAIPELLALVQAGLDEANEAMVAWTLLELVPFLPVERATELEDQLRTHGRHTWSEAGHLLWLAASLGDDPGDAALRSLLDGQPESCLVACRWIRVRAADFPYDRTPLLEQLDQLRRVDLQRPAIRLAPADSRCSADLAEAWLSLQGAPLDAFAARALLTHWRVDRRRQAVAWLAEHGADLPVRERADLAIALWDGDPDVRAAAAEALVRWRLQGFVGFASLHQLAREHADPSFRALCARSAAALATIATELPPADAALFAALDRDLQERAADAPTVLACSRAARSLLGDVLHLAPWCHADALGPLLQHTTAAGEPTHDAVQAVTGWIAVGDADVQAAAWCFLAHWPQVVAAALPMATAELRTTLMRSTSPSTLGEAFEALAWLDTRTAPAEHLVALCKQGNARELVRALAELLVRGESSSKVDPEQLQALVRGRFDPVLRWPLDPSEELRLHADVGDVVRLMAAMQGAMQGVPLPADDGELDALLQDWCGAGLAELPGSLASWRKDGSLPQRIDALEDRCRSALHLRRHLVWPRLAKS